MSSIGSNRKESRPMESQKLPESRDLEQSSSPLSLLHFLGDFCKENYEV